MNEKYEIFAQEVDIDELEAATGGSRDYAAEGCSSTTELEGFCVFSDKCFSMITTYIHPKWTEPCPVCGNQNSGPNDRKLLCLPGCDLLQDLRLQSDKIRVLENPLSTEKACRRLICIRNSGFIE